jgi:hypothetical protein
LVSGAPAATNVSASGEIETEVSGDLNRLREL